MILTIAFCKYYWNFLEQIYFLQIPLLPTNIDEILSYKNFISIIIIYVIISAQIPITKSFLISIESKLFSFEKDTSKIIVLIRELSYFNHLIDSCFALYLVLYALNIVIKYVNNSDIQIENEIIIAIIYLLYNSHSSYICQYKQREYKDSVINTHYCDNNQEPISKNSIVFYKGKEYKIISSDNDIKYRLQSYNDKKIATSELILLETAAADTNGKLYLKK